MSRNFVTPKAAIWKAPWTRDQVAILNNYQNDGRTHSYTCGHDGRHQLVATEDGWRCPFDDYRQDWAHNHSIRGEW